MWLWWSLGGGVGGGGLKRETGGLSADICQPLGPSLKFQLLRDALVGEDLRAPARLAHFSHAIVLTFSASLSMCRWIVFDGGENVSTIA